MEFGVSSSWALNTHEEEMLNSGGLRRAGLCPFCFHSPSLLAFAFRLRVTTGGKSLKKGLSSGHLHYTHSTVFPYFPATAKGPEKTFASKQFCSLTIYPRPATGHKPTSYHRRFFFSPLPCSKPVSIHA